MEKTMRIADRMKKIDSSGIRKVFNLAAQIENPVNLSIGQPDFPVPDAIKEAAVRAIMADKNSYTLTQGIPELKALIEKMYKDKYGFQAEASVITSGVSGGLLLALMAIVNPGDEVLIPDPSFVMYKHLVNLLGGVPVFYDTYPDFKVPRQEIAKKITDRTKVLLVNSPSNPTGAVLAAEDLKFLASAAKKAGAFVITDEIYDEFVYDGDYHSLSEYPEARENLLVLNGFSKAVSITGWRVGYALGPADVINEMIKLQQYSFVCAPSFAQYALLKLLEVDRSGNRESYRKKRDYIYEELKDRYKVVKPGGAFYMFPPAPAKYRNSAEFVEKAIGRKVLVIPGNVFSERDTHFRISFAADDRTLERGVTILNELAE
jgi:aspartate aminotransferase/aminotransferase